MSLVRSADPATEPVTVADVRAWLDVRDPFQEERLKSLIASCREMVETETGRSLIQQTWVQRFDAFPARCIPLYRPPVQSVSTVKYYDTDNAQQTLSSALYDVDVYCAPARLEPVRGESWPSTYDRMNAVEITYVAGYADADAVPEKIKEVILQLVDHFYEHTGAVTELRLTEAPITFRDQLWPYKVHL